MYQSDPLPYLESQTKPLSVLNKEFEIGVEIIDSQDYKEQAFKTFPEDEQEGILRA